ncbi:MAG: hypothetical protein RIA09_14955 [Hoeflea sp.]|uniref:hypothetical protein n=1 Tax=Hoeflea sp. TaxID=1940281 RepID=UPI0032EB8178
MSVKSFAAGFKAKLKVLRKQGVAAIDTDELIRYFGTVENGPDNPGSPQALKEYEAALAQQLETIKLTHASDLEMFKSVIDAGQNSIRTMIAINGGASVAMLAFMGHLASNESNQVANFAASFAPFAVGTFLAGLVSGVTYLSQWLYGGNHTKWGFALNLASIALGAGAYACFAVGAYQSYNAFISYL